MIGRSPHSDAQKAYCFQHGLNCNAGGLYRTRIHPRLQYKVWNSIFIVNKNRSDPVRVQIK